MAMQLCWLVGEWNAAVYDALLRVAERREEYCALALRKSANANCLNWVRARGTDLRSQTVTRRWPGTEVYDESQEATLLKFRVSSELITAMRCVTAIPFDWIGPDLPEDLAFLRADGRPWFVSIAHEGQAYFKLAEDELAPLQHQLGDIELVAQGNDETPDERY